METIEDELHAAARGFFAESPESVQQFVLTGPPRDRREEFVGWVTEYFAQKVGIEPSGATLQAKPKRAIRLDDETGDDGATRSKIGGK